MNGARPMLTWGHVVHGTRCWTTWYLDDPASPTAGVESHFIPGDLADVDDAVDSAVRWLRIAQGDG